MTTIHLLQIGNHDDEGESLSLLKEGEMTPVTMATMPDKTCNKLIGDYSSTGNLNPWN